MCDVLCLFSKGASHVMVSDLSETRIRQYCILGCIRGIPDTGIGIGTTLPNSIQWKAQTATQQGVHVDKSIQCY